MFFPNIDGFGVRPVAVLRNRHSGAGRNPVPAKVGYLGPGFRRGDELKHNKAGFLAIRRDGIIRNRFKLQHDRTVSEHCAILGNDLFDHAIDGCRNRRIQMAHLE